MAPKTGPGRPYLDHRPIIRGMWGMRTGAPWRDVPARFAKWLIGDKGCNSTSARNNLPVRCVRVTFSA
ncbi:hypothetical protein ACFSC4_03675 [Deinococcus malanensis]|uniref:hypothetical protein n=1 Tax=Deinococcus malanensis TaxID=1706855 RepID=UPI003570AC18